MESYGRDFEYFHTNYDEISNKYKNQFVSIKNLKIYHDANPISLLEQLRADGVDDAAHVYIVTKVTVMLDVQSKVWLD